MLLHLRLFVAFNLIGGLLLSGQSGPLQTYIQQGLQNNLNLQKEAYGLDIQSSKVAEAKANRLPVVTFEPDYLLAAGGRRLEFPVGDLFNPAYSVLNQLTQQNTFPTNLENVDEQLTPNNFHDTRLYAAMPIYNPAIYHNIKAQEQLISVEQAKINTLASELKKNIKVAYYNYLKTFEVSKIFDESESLLKELFRFNQKLVKYDKATPDVQAGVRYELEQIKGQRIQLEQQRVTAQAYFNSLLNRDFDAPIDVDETIWYGDQAKEDLTEYRQLAVGNRTELSQLDNAIKANEIGKEIVEKSLLPTVGISATAGFQGDGYTFNSEQLLGTMAIGAKWTIFDGKKRKRQIEQAELSTLQLQKEYALVQQQIELQVINAWNALRSAEQQIVTEQAAVNSAWERLKVVQKRYENEKAILIEYLDARTKWTTAKIQLAVAKYEVLIRQAELDRAVAY